MSTKTGIAFQCNIAAAVAVIVHGLTKISSPGSMSKLPTAIEIPDVQELTTIACFTLKKFLIFVQNF